MTFMARVSLAEAISPIALLVAAMGRPPSRCFAGAALLYADGVEAGDPPATAFRPREQEKD